MWMGLDADRDGLAHSSYQLSRNTADWMDDETAPPPAGWSPWPPSPSSAAATLGTTAACGDDERRGAGGGSGPVTLRLGYFPNITHAPAVVGVEKGIFAEKLGSDVKLETEDLQRRPGRDRGALLRRARRHLHRPEPGDQRLRQVQGRGRPGHLRRRLRRRGAGGQARHQLGRGPQGQEDRHPAAGQHPGRGAALLAQGEGPDAPPRRAAATSQIVPQENAQTVETFSSGAIDGAWVPEPFVSRLVNAGGKVLVDERDLWPDGKFVITNLIVQHRSSSRRTRTW